MNLLKKYITKHAVSDIESAAEIVQKDLQVEDALGESSPQEKPHGNVIPLLGQESLVDKAKDEVHAPKHDRINGLIGSEQVKAFFNQNHFGLGRHNGVNYRTIDAMEFGRNGRIAEFKNAIRGSIEQIQAKIDRLASTQLQTDGVCRVTSTRLALAISQLERDLNILCDQSELASEGKGWVLEALNRYQSGFVKGMREAVEAELILG